ncbi:MAG: glycosyl transferase [Chitinivibrionales bacterium]|nr:glycosyl transferase [Chitinivibrionales bacterium]
MTYGYFDDKNFEYVITNPKTPVKWINYIGTIAFGGFVDHTGGALICKGDPALNRITRYIPQLPSSEFKGTTLYVRISGNGQYQVISPYFVPSLNPYDRYECHVGPGYSKIVSEIAGVRTETTIFVPFNDHIEIRDIRITNIDTKEMFLDAIPVNEYTHPDALKQFTNADWVPQTMQSRAIREDSGTCILIQYPFMFRDIKINFFTSSHPVSSFETDRSLFLGDHEYGTWANPQALAGDELSCCEANRGDNLAALMHRFGSVAPGESRRFITLLGQVESITAAMPIIEKYRNHATVDSAFEDMRMFWKNHFEKMQVSTPDADMNRMLNIHNPRQCYITKNWSRYLSLYQLGFGARGIGVRDSSQDVLGVMDRIPAESRDLLKKLLSVQNTNGSSMHQFNPVTMIANEGDSREREDHPHYYGDDHLWAIPAVTSYIKETGDIDFLDENIPFYNDNGKNGNNGIDTVLDHMQRALAFTNANIGAHGLPLLGFADWNDTINLAKGAESMFIACLYGLALTEMIELLDFCGRNNYAHYYRNDFNAIKRVFNKCAWDGEWYVRYFDVDGTPLGSNLNEHGKIYVNAQSWPVIAGFAEDHRGRKALDSAYKLLNTKNGIKLSAPGFNGFAPNKGGITTYPPGAKENGGIFLHTNPWMMIAETIMGNGDRAFEYYTQINPAAKNDKIDEYECEPYVYAQNILADEHPQFGLGRNSWLSGTASWAYQAGTRYILGIRPEYQGLTVDPCIPKQWDGFTVNRRFRGAHYTIEVINPDHVSKGVTLIVVDGKQISGKIIPILDAESSHEVKVILGAG